MVIPTCLPSLPTRTSGIGVETKKRVAAATGAKPYNLALPDQSANHKPPATNKAMVNPPICGINFTAPGCAAPSDLRPVGAGYDVVIDIDRGGAPLRDELRAIDGTIRCRVLY